MLNENKIIIPDTLKNKVKLDIEGFGNNIVIHEGIKITPRGGVYIVIKGNNNHIEIYEECTINHNLHLNIFPAAIGAIADHCSIIIGAKSYINGVTILNCGEENTMINIGSDCLFANNIRMQTSDNHSIIDINTLKRTNIAGDIKIGDYCWICDDVKILNNVDIGSNCVIATMALVTNLKTHNNCILGGIPARIIRENITWDIKCIGNNSNIVKNKFNIKNILKKIIRIKK